MRRVSSLWIVASIAAACTATAGLAGCHHEVTAQDAMDTASDVGSAAVRTYMDGVDAVIDFGTDLSAALKDGDLSAIKSVGATRVVVRDAASGEEFATVTDQDAIGTAFKAFSSGWGVAPKLEIEGLTPEYQLELWQKETVKLGKAKDRVAEVQVATITTYAGSDVITVSLGKGKALKGVLSVNLTAPDAASVDALRALAG